VLANSLLHKYIRKKDKKEDIEHMILGTNYPVLGSNPEKKE